MTKAEELLSSVQLELARAIAQIESLKAEVRQADLPAIRDALAKLDVLNPAALLTKIATLEEQVAELKKWREERDRRGWQFWLGVGICGLTFTANLVMNFLLYLSRKPG